jgi:hypothetical protein
MIPCLLSFWFKFLPSNLDASKRLNLTSLFLFLFILNRVAARSISDAVTILVEVKKLNLKPLSRW